MEPEATASASFRGPCDYAEKKSDLARVAEIEVYTIGYGINGGTCRSVSSGGYEGASSPYEDTLTTRLLADMAMGLIPQPGFYDDGGDGFGGLPFGCPASNQAAIDSENADGDRFLCEARDNALAPVFRAAAEALAGGSRLIKIPPGL